MTYFLYFKFLSLSILKTSTFPIFKSCLDGYLHFYSDVNRVFYNEANSGDPDRMTHSGTSNLGLYCLPMSHTKDAKLMC